MPQSLVADASYPDTFNADLGDADAYSSGAKDQKYHKIPATNQIEATYLFGKHREDLDLYGPLDILCLMTITDAQRQFVNSQRVGHLATADASGEPHVTPVCYALAGANLYITIDDKPKRRQRRPLKRLRNIAENRFVTFVVDHYDDRDWSRLCWLMLRGQADILHSGAEHAEAQRLLRARYAQLHEMAIERHPVIAIRIERATSWGPLALRNP